jgi:glycosyltransferase involved in cell wall biosynthesis
MTYCTIVVPAYNEADSIRQVVERIRSVMSAAKMDCEVVVVVDGATDQTAENALPVADSVIVHPVNLGYGRSLKTGILAARSEMIAITDADGTYPVERLPEMLRRAERFHMVVGARTGRFYQGSMIKRIGRIVFRQLSEFAAGQSIPDINSGLRVFRRSQIMPFFPIISAGFSFTTTSTLAYLLNDLLIDYLPIEYHRRSGQSKVHHLRDSLRALQIILEAILRCNPIKAFLLLAVPFAVATTGFGFGGLIVRSMTMVSISAMFLCTTGLIMGGGFLAVAVMPQRRIVDQSTPLQSMSVPTKTSTEASQERGSND